MKQRKRIDGKADRRFHPNKNTDGRFKSIKKTVVRNLLLRPDVDDLLPLIAAKLHLEKKNIKGVMAYSNNEIIERCITYTARMLEVTLTPTKKEKAHGKGSIG